MESPVVEFPNKVTGTVLNQIDEDICDDAGCLDGHDSRWGELLSKNIVVTRLDPGLVVGFVGLGRGRHCGIGTIIEDRGHDVGVGRSGAASTIRDGAAHPDGGVRRQIGGDDDVGTLPDTECEDVGDEGGDGDEVLGDDGEVVLVNGELLHAFRAPIDDSHAVGLACNELEG